MCALRWWVRWGLLDLPRIDKIGHKKANNDFYYHYLSNAQNYLEKFYVFGTSQSLKVFFHHNILRGRKA